MRIISFLVALPLVWNAFVPQFALASTFETNETKTKFKIQDNISINNNIENDNTIFPRIPYNYPGYEPILDLEEVKRNKALERFKKKLEGAVFPTGKFVINASAYTAAADECGKSDGITASGLKVKEKRTIACPPQFPFGTKIKIDGYGTYVCEDRGGAIKGNKIDIYMKTKKQAFEFGRRNLLAEVVR